MDSYARMLFSIAAIFNYTVGTAFLFAAPQVAALLGINPIPTDPLLTHSWAALVLVFGWGYQQIARDPVGNRPIVRLGILGKSAVVLAGYWDWHLGNTNWVFPALLLGDVLFLLLFLDYLRRRPIGGLAGRGDA